MTKTQRDARYRIPTKEHNYLDFAETKPAEAGLDEPPAYASFPFLFPAAFSTSSATRKEVRQAVRSLGPVGCACYQACTSGLSTRSSPWDLDSFRRTSGKTYLGGGFALRCFQRFSFLDVAIQRWGGHPNWLTSGRAISVLSYWR